LNNINLRDHLEYYRSQHRTLGCKLTHLVGVPFIAFAIPMFFLNRKKAAMMFSFGWFLQLLGHYVFEHNKPILFTRGRSPYTAISALVFVGEEWMDTLRAVRDELNDMPKGKNVNFNRVSESIRRVNKYREQLRR